MFKTITVFSHTIKLGVFFNMFGFFALLIYNLIVTKKKLGSLSKPIKLFVYDNRAHRNKNLDKFRKPYAFAVLETVIMSFPQFFFGVLCNEYLGRLLLTGQNYFGFAVFAPWLFFLFCLLVRANPIKNLDLYTPAYAVSLMCFKISCFCDGCCYGFEWEKGIFDTVDDDAYRFPAQLLELAVAFVIFIVLLKIKDKMKPGTMQPMYLILYSSTRFFTEFTRADFEPLVWRLTTYHFQCLAGVIIGTAVYLLMKKNGEKISDYFTKRFAVYHELEKCN